MSQIQIPANAIGHSGMLAWLKRLPSRAHGRLVVVIKPAGYLTQMVGSQRPAFSWLVRLVGDPIVLNGKACREVYVADVCLVPVADVDAAALAQLTQRQNRADWESAMTDLARILNRPELSLADLEAHARNANHQKALERALCIVPTAQALREIGFTGCSEAGEDCNDMLSWAMTHDGMELRLLAMEHPFMHGKLFATGRTERTVIQDEVTLPREAARGQIVSLVLKIWQHHFSRAGIPDGLQLGHIYQRHQRMLTLLKLELPQLRLHAPAFRAIRRWLLGDGQSDFLCDSCVSWRQDGDMLRLKVDGAEFGCPVTGVLVEPCQISLTDLASLPPRVLRARLFVVVQTRDSLLFNGHVLRTQPID